MSPARSGVAADSVAVRVAARRLSWSSWLGKGALSLVDQALISGSNFFVSILLARWLMPEQHGAYALAFEAFLMLSVVNAALVLEPMSVFAPSVYSDCHQKYLGVLLWIYVGLAVATMLVLGTSAWVLHEFARPSSLTPALAGMAFGSPCILLFWLARRAFYVKLAPLLAVSGALLYCAIVLGLLWMVYRWGVLSPFTAFLMMAAGALAAGLLLLTKLKPALKLQPRDPSLTEVVQRHWAYGRWALASSIVMHVAGSIYYPLIGGFRGLAQTGVLKALMNLHSPVATAFSVFSLLSLPYTAHIHHQDGPVGAQRVAWRLTMLYAGGAVAYWGIVILLREPILSLLYASRYGQVAPLVPWLALGSVLRIAATAQAISLRAIQLPSLVLVAYGVSSAVAVLVGFPATWAFGLWGAVLTPILSNGAALVVASILLGRSLQHAREA